MYSENRQGATQSLFLTHAQVCNLFIALSWWYFKTCSISGCFSSWLVTFYYTLSVGVFCVCVSVCMFALAQEHFRKRLWWPAQSLVYDCLWQGSDPSCVIGKLTQFHLIFPKYQILLEATPSVAPFLFVLSRIFRAQTRFSAFSVIRVWQHTKKIGQTPLRGKDEKSWNISHHKIICLSFLFHLPSWLLHDLTCFLPSTVF